MKSPNWDLAACSLSDCNMPLYHETLRCIASIHSYVVNEGKFDTSMDTFGKWCEYCNVHLSTRPGVTYLLHGSWGELLQYCPCEMAFGIPRNS